MSKKRAILHKDLRKYTGYELEELLDLTGIRGVNFPLDASSDVTVKKNGKKVEVIISTAYYIIVRKINKKDSMIENAFIHIYEQKAGNATKILQSQIQNAKKRNFQTFKCTAHKGENCTGYIVWAKLGYLMNIASLAAFQIFLSEEKIKYFLQERNIIVENLHYFITRIPEGEEIWKNNGFRWVGVFDLEDNSISMRIFDQYLQAKPLN